MKNLLKMLFPCEYVQSVFDIDYAKLRTLGFRAVVLDIDGTLVPHGADATEAVEELFLKIHAAGLKTILLSNNGQDRILRFLQRIDSAYISNAEKPRTDGFLRAVELLKVKKEEAVVIGDQLFTDILGANRSGMASILVRYLCHENETRVGKRRKLEILLLKLYARSACRNRLGGILKTEGGKNEEKAAVL